jgi:hypothetical protein
MATTDHPTPVSPFLHRPGLDPAPAPEPNLHLLGGIWIATCPTCGFQLATAPGPNSGSSGGPLSESARLRPLA